MILDELDTQWRAANEAAATREQREQLIAATRRRLNCLWGSIFRRDMAETIAAVFVVIFLGRYMLVDNHVVRISAWWLVIWAVQVVYKMHRTRTSRRPAPPDAAVREYCRIELDRLDLQIQLLRNVLWWYIAPCMVGVNIFFIGQAGFGIASLFYGIVTLLLAWGIYSLNRRAVVRDLVPRRNELASLLSQLEDAAASPPSSTDGDAATPAVAGAKDRMAMANSTVLTAKWIGLGSLTFLLAGLAFIALVRGAFDSRYDGAARSEGPSGASLADLITELREQHKLVGLAAMVMVDGKIVAAAADGERKLHSGVPIELGDRWHLGSITKSITATMIARLVESGRMKWTDTIGERFSDAVIHDDWKQVTLEQLLTHTSGAPANFSLAVRLKEPALGPECTRERRKAVIDVMAEKPSQPPGEKFAYSNVGYTIAGAMAESATGVRWEDLVKREVFEPLKLADAGFGPPKSSSQTLDQPRGHETIFGWKVSAMDGEDNTPIMGPCGAIHMTLGNLCQYATEHLRGELGSGKLLAAETYHRLHKPVLQNYACGWVVKQPTNETAHKVYWHNGSNTMWYALVVFIPEKNAVVAVASNDGDIKQAESAAWKIVNHWDSGI